jgi:hypothetical protein
MPFLPFNNAPFSRGMYLRDFYKDPARRQQAVEHLQWRILFFLALSIVFAPFILLYQIWDIICDSLEVQKQDTVFLSTVDPKANINISYKDLSP